MQYVLPVENNESYARFVLPIRSTLLQLAVTSLLLANVMMASMLWSVYYSVLLSVLCALRYLWVLRTRQKNALLQGTHTITISTEGICYATAAFRLLCMWNGVESWGKRKGGYTIKGKACGDFHVASCMLTSEAEAFLHQQLNIYNIPERRAPSAWKAVLLLSFLALLAWALFTMALSSTVRLPDRRDPTGQHTFSTKPSPPESLETQQQMQKLFRDSDGPEQLYAHMSDSLKEEVRLSELSETIASLYTQYGAFVQMRFVNWVVEANSGSAAVAATTTAQQPNARYEGVWEAQFERGAVVVLAGVHAVDSGDNLQFAHLLLLSEVRTNTPFILYASKSSLSAKIVENAIKAIAREKVDQLLMER